MRIYTYVANDGCVIVHGVAVRSQLRSNALTGAEEKVREGKRG